MKNFLIHTIINTLTGLLTGLFVYGGTHDSNLALTASLIVSMLTPIKVES